MQQIRFPHRLGFKEDVYTTDFAPNMLFTQHDKLGHLPFSVHASEEPSVCIMQIQTLIHATNTISSQAWVQEDFHTTDFAPNMLFTQHGNLEHLPFSVHASEEPFVCIMQIQTLIHATNTISSQAWVQEDVHTTDFAPNMLFTQHDNLEHLPFSVHASEEPFVCITASCRFRR